VADDIELDAGSGGAIVSADDIAGVMVQRVKVQYGTDGSATDVSDTNPMPVDDAGGSLTVDGSVSLAAALPAGTNNIGDVDVLTQPGQAADGAAGQPSVVSVIAGYDGSNVQTIVTDSSGRPNVNINGTVPVSDAGGNISIDDGGNSITVDGTVSITANSAINNAQVSGTAVSVNSGTKDAGTQRVILASDQTVVPISDNSGSLTVDNGGTFAVQDSEKIADDAAFTVGTTKVSPVGYLADQASTDSVNEGDVGAARMTLDRKQITTVAPSADTAVLYVKLYNATAANTTVGTTTPIMTIPVPPSSGANVEFTNGITFGTALSAAATTGVADADTGAPAANVLIANLLYQ
jgi:hypothetical protein